MSGAAAVCSASVISTVRASTQPLAMPWSANAAATMRLLTTSPTACTASRDRGDTSRSTDERVHQPVELVELAPHLGEHRRAAGAGHRGRHRQVPLEQRLHLRGRLVGRAVLGELRDRHQLVGDAGQRRHHHQRRALPVFACCCRTMPIRRLMASGSATDVPPNFITTLTTQGGSGMNRPPHSSPRGASARRSGSRRRPRRGSCCGRARRTCSRAPDSGAAGRR